MPLTEFPLTGRAAQPGEEPLGRGGRFAVESYLDHHAGKLGARFDANSYVVLSEAMNSHDVGRGRGGTAAALAAVRVPVVVGGVDSDRLYPPALQQRVDAICGRLRPSDLDNRRKPVRSVPALAAAVIPASAAFASTRRTMWSTMSAS